jgi:hypothetical protein
MNYKCSKCGQEHEGWPSIAFNSPDHYDKLSDDKKTSIAQLSDDFCMIKHPEQTDRFIRAVIHQKVKNDCRTLDYGVWVSLSEKNYKEYLDNYDNEGHEATYFGFLCNNLTGYEGTLSVRSNVVLRGKIRPEVIPHDDQMDNDFVRDYYDGIDKDVAEERIKKVLGM